MTRPGSFDLSRNNVALLRDGTSRVVVSRGPHGSVDGYLVGAPKMTQSPPHDGALHPDGDELLFLVSGAVDVVLEEPDGHRVVSLAPGHGVVVPKGIWHRVVVKEPCQLIHVTPGPGGDHRPLRR